MRNLGILLVLLIASLFVFQLGSKFLPNLINTQNVTPPGIVTEKVVKEQSVVIDVVKKVSPSVVTIGVVSDSSQRQSIRTPFGIFFQEPQSPEGESADNFIGTGFVVEKSGLIVTNKHVVSDTGVKYIVVDSNGKKYEVGNIYRDPSNDVAILKISNPPSGGFKAIEFGDSDKIEVGQFAIAIGTALGEFRNTVTTGVVSGLGRGITAGSAFQGFVERLDNVIQTDAAINPGNSGGPLLNIAGQVVGINTAVSQSGQNIGFAIPINLVRDSIKNFNETGQFNRPFLGISYALISRQAALLNDVPEGALVREVVDGSAAASAGVLPDDIITQIDGQKITEENSLAEIISKKKVGDTVTLSVYRESETQDLKATLTAAPQ